MAKSSLGSQSLLFCQVSGAQGVRNRSLELIPKVDKPSALKKLNMVLKIQILLSFKRDQTECNSQINS